ncbi:hypothetical protein [Leadbetterella sp. DM7]|uniref:hypothetical protein n=1 Tax=Leadbetterella sp. DM7 TaxID=3235085 RepID=UPI00349E9C2B
MSDFKIGDEVFHKSNSSIKWIIERISENEVHCSTIVKETLELRKEVFTVSSLSKYEEPKITFVERQRHIF